MIFGKNKNESDVYRNNDISKNENNNSLNEQVSVQPPVDEKPIRPQVRIVNEATNYGIWVIPEDKEIFVGRDSSICEIQVLDGSISRKHCGIRYDKLNEKFIITDYSTNGTFLSNGKRMDRLTGYFLESEGCVMLSSQQFILEVKVRR